MDETTQTRKPAYTYIKEIVEGIGARPAGSPSEHQVLRYVERQLLNMGYSPRSQEVAFAPLSKFFPMNFVIGTLLVAGSMIINVFPGLAIWLPFLFMIIPRWSKALINTRSRSEKSENIFAYSSDDENLPMLVLCAHVDSARAIAIRNRTLRKLYFRALVIIQRVAFVIAFVSFLVMFGLIFPPGFITIIKVIAMVVGGGFVLMDLVNQFGHGDEYSPGAFDNASGVGVVLEVAEYILANPPSRIRLGFLFTGAEEVGLYGSDTYAQYLFSNNTRAAVLNIDMVGAGSKLYYVDREGTIFPKSTDRELNKLLHAANPEIRPFWYTLRSGDFSSFLKHKIKTTSLQTGGVEKSELVYHNIDDTMEVIEESALVNTVGTVKRFIELLPYSDWVLGEKK